jgi:hypothetical protein
MPGIVSRLLIVSALVVCVSGASVANLLRTVARTDQPTVYGNTFQTFPYAPVINNLGRVAFPSFDSEGDYTRAALWSEGFGTLTRVLNGGDPTPGLVGGRFGAFGTPVLHDSGDMAFAGLDFGQIGIWKQTAGIIEPLVVVGQPAPGTDSIFGSSLYQSLFSSPGYNEAGQSTFYGWFTEGSALFPADVAMFTDTRGPLELVARAFRIGPAGVLRIRDLRDEPVINDNGEVAYGVNLVRGAFTAGAAIYAGVPGAIRTVVQSGEQVPNFPTDVKWDHIYYFSFNASGDTAFAADLRGPGITSANDMGLWVEQNQVPQVVARKGEQAAGAPAGQVYGNFFSHPALNSNRHLAFDGWLAGTGVDTTNDTAIWAGPIDNLAIIAREGDVAPGAHDLATFAHIHYAYFVSMNAAGQVAFLAELAGDGVTLANNTGIYATDRIGRLRLIAREGDPLEVTPGITKIVQELTMFDNTNNEDGQQSSFNDLGQLAFRAVFTDFTEGIFVSSVATVPEPPAIVLFVLAGIVFKLIAPGSAGGVSTR